MAEQPLPTATTVPKEDRFLQKIARMDDKLWHCYNNYIQNWWPLLQIKSLWVGVSSLTVTLSEWIIVRPFMLNILKVFKWSLDIVVYASNHTPRRQWGYWIWSQQRQFTHPPPWKQMQADKKTVK